MNYVILSTALLAIGIYGLLTRRHLFKIMICVELIAVAATMNFVLLTSQLNRSLGEALLVLAFSTDACMVSIILGLLIIIFKKYGVCDIRKIMEMESSKKIAKMRKNNGDK